MTDQNKNENAESNEQDTVEVDAVDTAENEAVATDPEAQSAEEPAADEAAASADEPAEDESEEPAGEHAAALNHEAPEDDDSDGGKLIKLIIALTVILAICWVGLIGVYKRSVSERSQNLAGPTDFAPAVQAQRWNEARVDNYGREPVGDVEEGEEPSEYRYFGPTSMGAELLLENPDALAGEPEAAELAESESVNVPDAPSLEELLGETPDEPEAVEAP